MTMEPLVLERDESRVRILTLNRPDVLNALNAELMAALDDAVRRAAVDDAVGCVVLTGAGRGFCSGGDLNTRRPPAGDGEGPVLVSAFEQRVRDLRRPMEAARLLHEMDKPTIAMVNGPCAGAGTALAGACDLRFAGDSAVFKTAFNEVGLTGDYGGSWFWTRILGTAKVREFYLLSEKFDAARALSYGLVHRVLPDGELVAHTLELAGRLASRKPWAARLTKRNLNLAQTGTLAQTLDAEALHQTMASQALGQAMKQRKASEGEKA